jgi:hypothetical protein
MARSRNRNRDRNGGTAEQGKPPQEQGDVIVEEDPTGRNPSLEGMMVTNQGGFFNILRELFTGSRKPEEFIPRMVMDTRSWKRKLRIIANISYRKTGRIDIENLTFLDCIFIANGGARDDVIKVATGQQAMNMVARQGMGVTGGRTINKEQVGQG